MRKPILIIDNHDSFTFNLYQILAEISGLRPVVIRNDDAGDFDFEDFDRVVISPGPGTPVKPSDFGTSRRALEQRIVPVLGVCLGHQGLGHHFGADIIRAPEPVHGRTSRITHNGDELFTGIPQQFEVVRYHSLIVAAPLPPCLEVLAHTDDGLVMAMRHKELPFWGLQFHPESICTESGASLLQNFCNIESQTVSRAVPAWVPRQRPTTPPPATAPTYRLRHRTLPRLFDTEAVFVRLFAGSRPAFWLDSSLVAQGLSRFSFMGSGADALTRELRYRVGEDQVHIHDADGDNTSMGNLFSFLHREMQARVVSDVDLPLPFQGGYVGYLGYELKADTGIANAHTSSMPDACLLFASRFLAFDHAEGLTYLVGLVDGGAAADAALETWFDDIERRLAALRPVVEPDLPVSKQPLRVQLRRSRSTYHADIQACLEQIRAGESYEICLTNQLDMHSQVAALDFYRILRRRNPAPYAAFLQWDDFAIACSSPERFLRADTNGVIESKPIKGTRPRGLTPELDSALADDLRQCTKDRAENLMIVDLVRNDLGRTCEVGSVHVPKLMDVESYATTHQLVSTVRGQLRDDACIIDCIHAAFPGGSMTGAPKERTMTIIDALERGARGVYSGAIGYLGLNQAVDLNIVIRTAVISGDHYSIGAGGAIIALSDPDDEYHEMLLKTKALVLALSEATHGRARPDLVRLDDGSIDAESGIVPMFMRRRSHTASSKADPAPSLDR